MNRTHAAIIASFASTLLACSPTATVGASPLVSVPKDSPQRCALFCTNMGMSLESVVVIDNTVGCVCTPANATPHASGGASLAAAMAGRAAQEAAQSPTPPVFVPPPPPR